MAAMWFAGPAAGAPVKSKQAQLPPYAGAYQPQGVDERGIWMEADEDERALRDSRFVIHDAPLEGFIHGVLCRTVGADRRNGVRIYIVRVAAPNADMAPNGFMRIWTGLLLRVRSEAELGAVLAHEFGHFEERHTLAAYRQQRRAGDIAAWASFLGSGGAIVQMSAIGSIFSFNRNQERAADSRAFVYLASSPYRPGAAADFWERMMDEADATAAGRKQRSHRYDRVAFFATHPPDLERATTLRARAVKEGDEGEDAVAGYRSALAKWRPEFLADQLKLNDFAGSEYLLGQLAEDGWTADLLFARGELYRLRGNPRDLVSAAQFYRDAIAQGATDPAVHKSLGIVLLRSNAGAEGRQALQHYLALAPDAKDASMISALIEQSQSQ